MGGVFTSPASHRKGLLTREKYVRSDMGARKKPRQKKSGVFLIFSFQ